MRNLTDNTTKKLSTITGILSIKPFILYEMVKNDNTLKDKIYCHFKVTDWQKFKTCNLISILAKYKKYNKITKYLITKCNADTTNSENWTLLMIASNFGNDELCKFLIDGKVNLDLQNKNGNTALMITEHFKTAKLLMEAGANLDLQTACGYTALMHLLLHYRKTEDIKKIIDLLIEKGANLNLLSYEKCTALIRCTNAKRTEYVKLLIDAGANVNLQDTFGRTALIYASRISDYEQRHEIVKLLIEAKAKLDLQDKDGMTALLWASNLQLSRSIDCDLNIHRYTAKLLIDAKANIYLRNNQGKTAYELSEDKEIQNYLNMSVILQVWTIRELSIGYIQNAFTVYNIAVNVFLFLRPK